MKRRPKPITVLVAEDDPGDRLLIRDAFNECGVCNDLRFVGDGVELIDYFHGHSTGPDEDPGSRPDLILLDLNMPRKDGREALREIKADPRLRAIPVVVLTASMSEEDVLRTYDLGAAGYITKPVTFEGLVEVVKTLGRYWFEIVELPPA